MIDPSTADVHPQLTDFDPSTKYGPPFPAEAHPRLLLDDTLSISVDPRRIHCGASRACGDPQPTDRVLTTQDRSSDREPLTLPATLKISHDFAPRQRLTRFVRDESDRERIESFMTALGERVRGNGRIYFTGGTTAVLYRWRSSTIDIYLKADPEPAGLFEAIATLKEELFLNVELASPDDFIPAVPDWRERSLFIARHGQVDFFHYDPYGQALSKLQRGHDRDRDDVQAMVKEGLIDCNSLIEMFALIEPALIRYPAIDPGSFRSAVMQFCDENQRLE